MKQWLVRIFSLLLALAAFSSLQGFAQAPANLDFEEGEIGSVPKSWAQPKSSKDGGYVVQLTMDHPKSGKNCVFIGSPEKADTPAAFGNLLQSFEAKPYQGKRVRFRAWVRAEIPSSYANRAGLWMRVDRKDKERGFFDNMQNRPITEKAWREYEIVGDVAADAESIFIGAMLIGQGKMWIDAAAFDVLGAAGQGNEPPRTLTDRGLENLSAFTRLLGYVRYFHPSDQAAQADWNMLAINSVNAVEKAKDPEELASVLQKIFSPLAPTVRVYPSGQKPQMPAELTPPGASSLNVVAWRHRGVGTGDVQSIYSSERINSLESQNTGFGTVSQRIDATPYRGKKVRYRAFVRAEVPKKGDRVGLWLRVDRKNHQMGFFDNMQDRPITAKEWRAYEITADVADDAENISLGMLLAGNGKAWLDAASLEIVGNETSQTTSAIANADFEEGNPGAMPKHWIHSIGAGARAQKQYTVALTSDNPHSGKQCVVVESGKFEERSLPKPDEPFFADLPGGVSCLVPLALYADSPGTRPRATSASEQILSAKPAGFVPSGNDRATRLANVALAWNVFQHFYPYFDVVKTDWNAALRRALTSAATDADESAFFKTLSRLVAALHDGHGSVTPSSRVLTHTAPILWEWIENRLVVTLVDATETSDIKPGDVVLRVDGVPAQKVLAEEEELISGATPQWKRYKALQQIRGGGKDARLALEIQRGSERPRTVTLQRTLEFLELVEKRPPKIHEIKPGVMYVNIGQISDADFTAAIAQLEKAKGIVFDLRGYPGRLSTLPLSHIIDSTITCAQWHVPLVERPDRQKMTFDFSNWTVEPKSPRFKAKIAFITDGRAISYAETWMGMIEHYKLAEIVGGATAGTNGNVNPFTLPGNYRISWTGMKVLKHDGSQHHGIGIQPTVPAKRTIKGVAEGRDELLEKAVEVVSR